MVYGSIQSPPRMRNLSALRYFKRNWGAGCACCMAFPQDTMCGRMSTPADQEWRNRRR